ncbi:uncharacterized protein OCT59_002144 [Rhizophagus irregularis]|nr:hypothetical protein OCT59_002144 [Rhizophagus irregularis]
MEYADESTLDSYLNKHIVKLSLYDKYRLAIQLASAVLYMHECDIIHRNLNPKNILVHQKNIKVAGFGLAKKNSESTINIPQIFGVIPYIDPKFLSNHNYELDKKEKFTVETPDEYNQLYAGCWKYEPNERPTMQKVVPTLNFLLSDDFQDVDRYLSDDDDDDNLIDNSAKFIKNVLKNDDIKYIPFGNLIKPEPLNKGGFGSVIRPTWTETNDYVICKKLTRMTYVEHNILDAFIHELQIHLRLNGNDRIIRCLGFSKDRRTKDYLLVMKYANGGDLRNYLKNNFNNLTWDDKKRLAFQILDGLYYLHDENILHRDLHSKNILIHENNAKITGFGILKSRNSQASSVIAYMDPKRLLDTKFSYTKSSDIYSYGVLMWVISSGHPPFKDYNNIIELVSFINNGVREKPVLGTPIEYEELYKNCWMQEPEQRPTIDEIINEFKKMDFRNRLNPSELLNFIKDYKLTRFIKKDELTAMTEIYSSSFGSISKAIWTKTNNLVVCKKINNNESINKKQIEAFLHELDMHKRLDYCSRIIHILGISFDLNVQEYWLIMEYADGGDLRKYLKENFPELTWSDKMKLAYQITEGIKYLHRESILHRDLHSGNIVIHQREAKIIDLGIAKSTKTETYIHSGVLGVVAYIDPKRLENYLYEYNDKSDIYSLGVLMWGLSSGRPPFADENISDNLLRIDLISGRRE